MLISQISPDALAEHLVTELSWCLFAIQDSILRCAVHIYLCDDSPKDYKEQYNGQTFATVALRQQMIDALYQVHGIPVIRVTRVKGKGETNPKSANLNNCLKQIYGDAIPPESEVVAVFDADQAAHSNFFTSTLPWMDAGDDVALVQSPQVSMASPDSLGWFCSFVNAADGFHKGFTAQLLVA